MTHKYWISHLGKAALALIISSYFAPSPAEGQVKKVLNGNWKGGYSCGAAKGSIYLEISDRGDRMVFVDEVLGNAEYKLGSGYHDKNRRYVADLRPVTPFEKIRLNSFEGTVSPDGRSMKGEMKGCTFTDLVAGSETAPIVAAKPKPERKSVPEPTDQTVAEREAQGFVGSWEGESTACLKGPFDLRVDFGRLDAEGNDATITVRALGEADSYELPAKTGKGRVGLAVWAPPAPKGRFSRQPVAFELEFEAGGRMRGHSREMSCSGLRLSKAAPKTATQPSTVEPSVKYRALLGSWDGAAYDHRDGTARRISLVITKTTSDIRKRVLDVQVTLDGSTWAGAIMESDGDNAALLPVKTDGGSGTMRGSLSTKLHKKGNRILMTASTSGGGHGVTYLWKRPADRGRPLHEVCDELDPWIASQAEARRVARNLKIEFYPALLAYDADAASFSQTVADLAAHGVTDKLHLFETELAECLLSAKTITPAHARFATAFLDIEALTRQRIALSRTFSPEKATLVPQTKGISLVKAKAATDQAEEALDQIIAEAARVDTFDAILGVLERNRKAFQAARPHALADRLAAIKDKLEQTRADLTQSLVAQRREKARAIMDGIPVPYASFPPSQEALLKSVINGTFRTPGRDEIGFLAGMFGQSVEKCGKPAMQPRLLLVDLLKKGVVLALGSDYMGSMGSSLSSVAAGVANYADGVSFADALGCDDRFVDAFYDVLAATWFERSQDADGRPPLFVRSCALDRQPAQCQCIMSVVETVQPKVSHQEYSRGVIYSAMEMQPLIGIEIGTRCGVSNY